MASRSLKPEAAQHPRQVGDSMHQGASKSMHVPHGLAASMHQGTAAKGTVTNSIGKAMKQGK